MLLSSFIFLFLLGFVSAFGTQKALKVVDSEGFRFWCGILKEQIQSNDDVFAVVVIKLWALNNPARIANQGNAHFQSVSTPLKTRSCRFCLDRQ